MHVFIDEILGEEIRITGEDYVHLTKSLRKQMGDKITVIPLKGNQYTIAVIKEITRKEMIATVHDRIDKPRPSEPELVLVQAVLKKNKMDLILQKATELGVSRIIPLSTDYCVPDTVNLDRWQALLREAAMQSRRFDIPVVSELQPLAAFLKNVSVSSIFCLAEKNAKVTFKETLVATSKDTPSLGVMIGPEGGWSDKEQAQLAAAKIQQVSYGNTILRAETAAITALGVLRWWVS